MTEKSKNFAAMHCGGVATTRMKTHRASSHCEFVMFAWISGLLGRLMYIAASSVRNPILPQFAERFRSNRFTGNAWTAIAMRFSSKGAHSSGTSNARPAARRGSVKK
jgi:hypothetical protein